MNTRRRQPPLTASLEDYFELRIPAGDQFASDFEDEFEGPLPAFPRLTLKRLGVEFEQAAVASDHNKSRSGFTYIAAGNKHYYRRNDEGDGEKRVVEGYRGKIIVEQADGSKQEWPCVERANGFAHAKVGQYSTLTMQARASYPNNKELYLGGNLFIHVANYPMYLEGCIGPGKEVWEGFGVTQSQTALSEIIQALGGWEQGKQFPLEIVGYKADAG